MGGSSSTPTAKPAESTKEVGLYLVAHPYVTSKPSLKLEHFALDRAWVLILVQRYIYLVVVVEN